MCPRTASLGLRLFSKLKINMIIVKQALNLLKHVIHFPSINFSLEKIVSLIFFQRQQFFSFGLYFMQEPTEITA